MADSLCGPSNALQNFQKHTANDRTLQQDRFSSRPQFEQVNQLSRRLCMCCLIANRVSDHRPAQIQAYLMLNLKLSRPVALVADYLISPSLLHHYKNSIFEEMHSQFGRQISRTCISTSSDLRLSLNLSFGGKRPYSIQHLEDGTRISCVKAALPQ